MQYGLLSPFTKLRTEFPLSFFISFCKTLLLFYPTGEADLGRFANKTIRLFMKDSNSEVNKKNTLKNGHLSEKC